MFGDQPTPLDLRFTVARIPVRVGVMFWLTLALLGAWTLDAGRPFHGALDLLVWLACGFASILLHEFGHAVAARLCGAAPSVTLAAFGGYARYEEQVRSPWQRMGIAAAGPAVGLAFAALLYGSQRWLGWAERNEWAALAYLFLLLQGVFWNVFNLLPIWPLDGGKIFREALAVCRLRNPDMPTHAISALLAGGIAAYGAAYQLGLLADVRAGWPEAVREWTRPGWLTTVWFAMFAADNVRLFQAAQARGRYQPYDETDDGGDMAWRRR